MTPSKTGRLEASSLAPVLAVLVWSGVAPKEQDRQLARSAAAGVSPSPERRAA